VDSELGSAREGITPRPTAKTPDISAQDQANTNFDPGTAARWTAPK
jgi:hypothetical protein